MAMDKRITRLCHLPGFNEAFEMELRYHKTMKDAYEKVEELRLKYLGVRAYASYDSFRVCRKRFMDQHHKMKQCFAHNRLA